MASVRNLGIILLSSAAILASPCTGFALGYLDYMELKRSGIPIIKNEAIETSLAGNFLAAQIAADNNDAENAVDYFKKAIKLDGDNVVLKQSLFMALTSNGNISEAMELLKQIPVESQSRPLNHMVAAVDALKKKSWSRAVSLIDTVDGTDLDSMLSKLFGAWALYGDRKLDKAIARADGISGPDWTKVIKDYHTGLMLSAADRDKEAVVYLERAIENRAVAAALTETFIRAVEALARAHARAGNVEKAKTVIAEGLLLLPTHAPLIRLQQVIDSGAAVQPLVASAQQGAAEIFFNVGSAISRQGGLPFAQTHLQLAHYLDSTSNVTLLALANVYENQKKYTRANGYYGKIAETSPHRQRALLEIGLNLNQMGKIDEAIAELTQVVAKEPSDLAAVSALGGVYAEHKKFDEAVKLYDATIPLLGELEPRDWSILYRRGIAHERSGNWDLAEQDFKQALKLSPDQADVLNYLGYSWVDRGINLDEGLNMIRKAVSLRPNSGFIIDSLGWAYFRLGKYQEAADELDRALELIPTDPVVNDHLGDAYWKVGRKLEATFLWKHALDNEPDEKNKSKIEQKLKKGLPQ